MTRSPPAMRDWLVVSNQTPAGWVDLREQALRFNFSARFDRDELYCSTPSAYFIEESVCILMMLQRRQGRDRIPSDEESPRDRQPGPWGSSIPWGPHIPSSRFVLSFIKYMIKLYGWWLYQKIMAQKLFLHCKKEITERILHCLVFFPWRKNNKGR